MNCNTKRIKNRKVMKVSPTTHPNQNQKVLIVNSANVSQYL